MNPNDLEKRIETLLYTQSGPVSMWVPSVARAISKVVIEVVRLCVRELDNIQGDEDEKVAAILAKLGKGE